MIIELLILLLGIEIGSIWTFSLLWNKISKRCWGQIARVGETRRCRLHQGHEGKHLWYSISRDKVEYW